MTFQEVPKSFEFLRLKKQKECEQKEVEPEETRIKNNNYTLLKKIYWCDIIN